MSIYLYTTRLPNTYQEVEYIQSSGTQHIDTLHKHTTNTKFEVKFAFQSMTATYSWICWARTTYSSSDDLDLFVHYSNSSYTVRYWCGWTMNDSWKSITVNTPHVMTLSKTLVTLDSENLSLSASLSSCNYNDWLFWVNQQWSLTDSKLKAKVYYFKIYEWTTLVRYFVPCYRKSDNVIWMYDLVNNQFYTNAWTWSFTKWSDVIGEIEIKTMYIWEYINLDPITFSYTWSDQHRTVPYTGTYRITCKWAWSNTAAWWLGQWDLQLTQWDEYTIVVWQKWSATSWTTYWFWGSSNYSNNRAWWWLSWFFTGSTTVAATDSARALVIGGWAGWGQSSSRAWWKWGWETWQNWQWSSYWTAWGWWTQTWRNSWWNVWANQFNGWNWSRTYWWWGWGWWWWWNGSIWDGSWDDDKWAGGWSGYVISTASNRVLTQGWWSATWTDWSVLIEFIPS